MPKEFIRNVLIEEIGEVVKTHPYISFALISVGIELLGKCLLTNFPHWHRIDSNKAYSKGSSLMEQIDERYSQINLKDELRNGFAHTFKPKGKIALSEVKHGAINFSKNKNGQTILVAEEFYRDFVRACHVVLEKKFDDATDKMNIPFLEIKKS